MVDVVFDTSIIIDHLRNFKEATKLLEQVKNGLVSGYVSTLTLAELFSGRDAENPSKRIVWEEMLNLFTKIEVSEDIAKVAGEIKRRHGVSLTDAVIAATASSLHCKLLTQDIRDFAKVSEITAEKPY